MKKFLASLIFCSSLIAPNLQAMGDWYFKFQKDELQYCAEMMRGERHFYVMKTYEAIEKTIMVSIGLIALLDLYARHGNILGRTEEEFFEHGLQEIAALAVFLLPVQLVHQKRQRDNFNKNMNAVLQKHIDPQCDFKSLPIEQAMLFMAAHEKNSEMVRELASQQEAFLAQKGVKEALSELLGEENIEQLLRGTGE